MPPRPSSRDNRPAKTFSRPRPLLAVSLLSVCLSLLPSLAGFRFVNQGGVWPKSPTASWSTSSECATTATATGWGTMNPARAPTTSNAAAAAATMAVGAEGGGRLDWRRGLEILKEAHNAGVVVHPDLMMIVLSKAPMGNSRKVS